MTASHPVSAFQKVFYQFGNGLLEILSDYPPLIDSLDLDFEDYRKHRPQVSESLHIQCSVLTTANPGRVIVEFHQPENFDVMGLALSLLEHPYGNPRYTEIPSSSGNWRYIGKPGNGSQPVLSSHKNKCVVDLLEVGADFLTELVLNGTFALQNELMFLHAASLEIQGRGVLLMGPSGRGKSTLSLTLASRGHRLLSDDMAPLRKATREILPFGSSAWLRPGIHTQGLHSLVSGVGRDGRLAVNSRKVFPHAGRHPVLCTHVFFLRQFTDKPQAHNFQPTLNDSCWRDLSLNKIIQTYWNLPTHSRLMQFLVFAKLLSNVKCWILDSGSPEATADLIELLMEKV